jgi:hypothetical protein
METRVNSLEEAADLIFARLEKIREAEEPVTNVPNGYDGKPMRVVRDAPNADIEPHPHPNTWKMLGSKESIWLRVKEFTQERWYRCDTQQEAKKWINDTMYSSTEQQFFVLR